MTLKENIRVEGKRDIQTKVMTTLFALFAEGRARPDLGAHPRGPRPKGSLGASRLDGKEDEIRRFLELGVSKTAIAKLTGVSRSALYSFMNTRGIRPGLGPLPDRAGDNPAGAARGARPGEGAADALLGALDPARNRRFRDRYVGLPLDLTGVLFVAAAAGHLVPRRRGQHGLLADELSFSPAALRFLIGGLLARARRAPPRRRHPRALPPSGAAAGPRPGPAVPGPPWVWASPTRAATYCT